MYLIILLDIFDRTIECPLIFRVIDCRIDYLCEHSILIDYLCEHSILIDFEIYYLCEYLILESNV